VYLLTPPQSIRVFDTNKNLKEITDPHDKTKITAGLKEALWLSLLMIGMKVESNFLWFLGT